MKIKQYLGTDMRDALRQIRQELGADAVILSTRALGQGVEVSAAVDTETPAAAAVAAAAARAGSGAVAGVPPPAPTEQLAMSETEQNPAAEEQAAGEVQVRERIAYAICALNEIPSQKAKGFQLGKKLLIQNRGHLGPEDFDLFRQFFGVAVSR